MTAIEWLLEQMLINNYITKQQKENCDSWLTDEAMEMEKQQIIDAWNNGDVRQGNNKHINNADAYYFTLITETK